MEIALLKNELGHMKVGIDTLNVTMREIKLELTGEVKSLREEVGELKTTLSDARSRVAGGWMTIGIIWTFLVGAGAAIGHWLTLFRKGGA